MLAWGLLQGAPRDGTFRPPSAAEIEGAPSFAKGERVVATHYFYWYRWPDAHFDQLRLHFPDEREVSYESAAWHRGEIEDVLAAGIDALLPVYWGAVDHYDKPDVAFSVRGLPALVEALDGVAAAGRRPPRVGMFYDTTTLLDDTRGAGPRGGRSDLRTSAGRDVFYRTIRDFFCQVPPRHWARIEGQPLVVLYSAGFAGGWDQEAFDQVARRFEREFAGLRPFIVRDASWTGVRTDASCAWGAALDGPHLGQGTVQIGAGYDDTPVAGRHTPIREREDGRFYEKSWRAALRSDATLALIETWNEHHEGTSIAETVEYGRQYIELTARYAELFRKRSVLRDDIDLRFPEPRPRPDGSWGETAQGLERLEWRAGEPVVGLRPIPWEDGPFVERAGPGGTSILTEGAARGLTYLYFQVSDRFAFDVDRDFVLEVDYLGPEARPFTLEYDARAVDPAGGAYTPVGGAERGARGERRTTTFQLRHARFADRQNGRADLRLCVSETDLAVCAVRLAPAGKR